MMLWFLIIGGLLVAMALSASVLQRLPLTGSMIYLATGFLIGPGGLGLLPASLLAEAALLERFAEIAVLISLFTAGLKLSLPLRDPNWRLPLRLATVSMLLTIGAITLVGVLGLGLPPAAALLLGAILAPTDPVLASDVQVEHPNDRHQLRFGLTGEAGLNDGSAFPMVMLGLGLLGLHELGVGGWRWLLIDVLWATAGGLALGWLLGTLVARLVIYLRREHREAIGLDDFLALGLIALAYGLALLTATYGFLAVFAAGLALRQVEYTQTNGQMRMPSAPPLHAKAAEALATDAETGAAYMAAVVLGFNQQLERIAEVAIVVLLGALLGTIALPTEALWFVPLLLLVIRPLAVWVGMLGWQSSAIQRRLIGWFGIRGIGSLFYLFYAIEQGLPPELAQRLTALTLTVVTVSIIAHGISVTPLMNRYANRATAQPGR